MKTFLVGGAVRDRLLGLPVKDNDWVVTGTSPEKMLAAGFNPVGKDFPVFLHPKTGEEYALARTERKSAKGYHGFQFQTSEEVTLEQDLQRRDLTINALAEDENGNIIDTTGGKEDLKQRLLRHVSPAFAEDPVRILRIARFLARFSCLGFRIADETMQLMRAMVTAGEVNALVAERVWQETSRALAEPNPEKFIETLLDCGALKILFPEIECLFGVPQPEHHHPEIDTGLHTLLVLQQACLLSSEPEVRFAALTHDLGKGTTDKALLPHHYGHEARGYSLVKTLCDRYKIPKAYKQLAEISAKYHTHIHRAFEEKPKTLLKVLESTDAFRRPERFIQFLLVCTADSRGRPSYEDNFYSQADFFKLLLEKVSEVSVKDIVKAGFTGIAIREQLHHKRRGVVKVVREEWMNSGLNF
ncbi:MAG: multifunctional CCA addition/repair protein [Cocleimonas sp.]|nr:multifunctional CCA addition/repair protein [Cocleimonas sp.]